MSEIQPIIHRGRVGAIVVAGQAIILDALAGRERAIVKAMCLYALEVADGTVPGPYSDQEALAYARAAAAARTSGSRIALRTGAPGA